MAFLVGATCRARVDGPVSGRAGDQGRALVAAPVFRGFVQAAGEHTQSWVLVAGRSPGLTPERVPHSRAG